MVTDTTEKLLTVADVAALLKVHPLTVRRWIASGRLPAVKLGKSYRITPSAYRQLIAAAPAP
jgi:excisionase family DNA binding protein